MSNTARTGRARPGASNSDGAVLRHAEARKRRTYADVTSSQQAALVVLGCEAIVLPRRSEVVDAPPAWWVAAAHLAGAVARRVRAVAVRSVLETNIVVVVFCWRI